MDYKDVFKYLRVQEPPTGLFDSVIKRIQAEKELRTIRKRLAFFSVGLVISASVLMPAFQAFKSDLGQTGLIQFASLLFSDTKTVMVFWNDFAMTLLESLPALSLAAFLSAILAFLALIRFLARDIKTISSFAQLKHI